MLIVKTPPSRHQPTIVAEGTMSAPRVARDFNAEAVAVGLMSKDGKHVYSAIFTVPELEAMLKFARGEK